ncbi:MAG: PKD domain-containing protein [Candidatus Thermoplasmatota archaeon]
MKKIDKFVACIIVLFLIGILAYFYIGPPQVKSLSIIPIPMKNKVMIRANVLTSTPSSVSGEGKISIIYEEEVVYEEILQIKGSAGIIELPYEKFVIGNGIYKVTFAFSDKKTTKEFEIDNICEKISVSVAIKPAYMGKLKLDIVVTLTDRKNETLNLMQTDALLKVSVLHLELNEKTDFLVNTSSKSSYIFNYTVEKSGNYSIIAELEGLIKATSPYKKIKNETKVFANAVPIANAGGDQTVTIPVGQKKNVKFDASASYDPDGKIVLYCWDFDDGTKENTTLPIVEHEYEYKVAGDNEYKVSLIVIDDIGYIGGDIITLTIKAF